MTLSCVEVETGPGPRHSVIWLHGLGADGHDFEPLVPELVARDWPPLRFVFPHAPLRPVTLNNGMTMRAWYDVRRLGPDLDSRRDTDEAAVRTSIGQVDALIAREVERGVAAEKIVVAGFSQGGAIALGGALRYPQRLAGVVALSTYLPLADTLAAERREANAAVPIFQAHGRYDPVVPYAAGTTSRDALVAQGYAVEWHDYPMAHQVCAEEIADLRQWLARRLKS